MGAAKLCLLNRFAFTNLQSCVIFLFPWVPFTFAKKTKLVANDFYDIAFNFKKGR
jgi:hypothetical protein